MLSACWEEVRPAPSREDNARGGAKPCKSHRTTEGGRVPESGGSRSRRSRRRRAAAAGGRRSTRVGQRERTGHWGLRGDLHQPALREVALSTAKRESSATLTPARTWPFTAAMLESSITTSASGKCRSSSSRVEAPARGDERRPFALEPRRRHQHQRVVPPELSPPLAPPRGRPPRPALRRAAPAQPLAQPNPDGG